MNHKKTLASLLMLFVLAFSVILPAAQPEDAAAADIQVFVNGQYLSTDQPPVIQDGRTMVPLRAIFEALGAQVEYFADTRTVSGYDPQTACKPQLLQYRLSAASMEMGFLFLRFSKPISVPPTIHDIPICLPFCHFIVPDFAELSFLIHDKIRHVYRLFPHAAGSDNFPRRSFFPIQIKSDAFLFHLLQHPFPGIRF